MFWPEAQRADLEAPSVVAEGLVAGTPVATPEGWRAAERLHPGDPVLTFESGTRRVERVIRLWSGAEAGATFWPLRVPAGALDNRDEMLLLPEQKLLIEADVADDLYGDPFALIPAHALDGWRGIHRCRPLATEVVQLVFARDQIVYASRGTLISCPGSGPRSASALAALIEVADLGSYAALTGEQARHLVTCLMAEDLGAALSSAGFRSLG